MAFPHFQCFFYHFSKNMKTFFLLEQLCKIVYVLWTCCTCCVLGLISIVFLTTINHFQSLCPPPWGVDILFLLFSLSDVRCPMSGVRRPMSGVTHGFRSFKGKVLELLSPNLVCRLIGSVACLGLLLAVVPLLLTE